MISFKYILFPCHIFEIRYIFYTFAPFNSLVRNKKKMDGVVPEKTTAAPHSYNQRVHQWNVMPLEKGSLPLLKESKKG